MLRSAYSTIRISALCVALFAPPLASQEYGELPILTYNQAHPLLPDAGETPMVRVYASGLVRFHRPAGRKNPGEHEMILGDAELARFIELARSAGELPSTQSMSAPDSIQVGPSDGIGEELVYESDPTVTTIHVPRPAGEDARVLDDGSAGASSALKKIEVRDLSNLSRRSRVPAVESLKSLQDSMLELYESSGDSQ